MLKKKVSKIFDYPDMNAKVEITAYIHKVSYMDIQERKSKAVNFLKAVNKKDREALLDAFNEGNYGKILGNIEDIGAVRDLLHTLEQNILICTHDSIIVKQIPTNGDLPEIFEGKQAEKELAKEHIEWLAEECIAVNPELFNSAGIEKKKNN